MSKKKPCPICESPLADEAFGECCSRDCHQEQLGRLHVASAMRGEHHQRDDVKSYLPTQDEIARQCEAIRETWAEWEWYARAGIDPPAAHVTESEVLGVPEKGYRLWW